MKLLVGLCKHCVLARKDCIHYNHLHEKTIKIEAPGVLVHHCPIYYETIEIGTKVSVELMEYEPEEDMETLDYGDGMIANYPTGYLYPKWHSLGWVSGVVSGKAVLKGFYSVKLDIPVKIGRPDKNNMPKAIEVLIESVAKRANKIRLLSEAPNKREV